MTDEHHLSFADVILHQPNLAEVIVYEGIEIDMPMVEEYHDFLLSNLQAPFALLVNNKNHYTYTFEAQLSITLLKEVKAIAVLAYDRASRYATESLKNMPNHTAWNMTIFDDRDKAIAWLRPQLQGNFFC